MSADHIPTVRIQCDFCHATHYDGRFSVATARETAGQDGWVTLPGRTRGGKVTYARPVDACPEHAVGREAEVAALAEMQISARRLREARRVVVLGGAS